MSTVEIVCTSLLYLVIVGVVALTLLIVVLDLMGVDIPTMLEKWSKYRHERKMLKISKKYEHDKAKKLDASKPKMF